MVGTSTPPVPAMWVGVSGRGRMYEIVSSVFYSIACVAVILRVVARMRQFRRLFADDCCCIVAQVLAMGSLAIAILFTETAGMGWHLQDLPPAQLLRFFKIFYAAEIMYALISPFYKLAVVLLYRRIFGEVRIFNIAAWVMVALSIGWGIGGVFSTVFQCTPIAKAWNTAVPGHCVNTQSYILGNGIANMLIDAIILLMPLPMVWRLQLDLKRKLALTAMFLLGSIVCIASILRITFLVPIDLSDATYSLVDVALWSNIEPAIGIISACLPTLRQFFFSRKAAHSVVSSKWLSSHKAGPTSVARSEAAVALSGWKSAGMYAEVNSTNSRQDMEAAYDKDQYVPSHKSKSVRDFDFGDAKMDKSIYVNKEISVEYD